MKKQLRNNKGGIFLISSAVIVSLISLISAIYLIAMAKYDYRNNLGFQIDKIQQDLLLRSESSRVNSAIEYNENIPIPLRKVTINNGIFEAAYKIKTTTMDIVLQNYMGYPTAKAKAIHSLSTCKWPPTPKISSVRFNSPIKRYSEKLLRNESLAQYQYFTDIESSENADGGTEAAAVKFWGRDEFWGKVHSNDDIWIQQGGGGNNNGWPTFHDMVTTAGIFRHYPDGTDLEIWGAPMEDIFRGGWKQYEGEGGHIIFNPTADDIRRNGLRPFDNSKDIIYVSLNGNSYSSWYGDIEMVEVDTFGVYSWFPANRQQANAVIAAGGNWFEDSDHIWTNHVAIYDTTWTQGPTGTVNNQSVFVESELWISGVVGGKQTWGCADTVFIVGDITYLNTNYPDPPDGDTPNLSDYFGLVSEQKILIRYKHRDPETNEIRYPNCNDVILYGAFAAIGKGDISMYGEMACHYDGIFSFQYHHPHGSTPDFVASSPYTGADTLYTYIDLHKFIYNPMITVPYNIRPFILHGNVPQYPYGMCGYPYESPGYLFPNNSPYVIPYGTDYPWYNPVWPESAADVVTERGNLYIFGAIAQRRRGFIHRSGSDDYNHPPGNQMEWDLSVYHYDGDHPSVGYNKRYKYDQRFQVNTPPDYPQIYYGFGEAAFTGFNEEAWNFKTPPAD